MVKITKCLSFGLTTACFFTMLLMSSCYKEGALVPTSESAVNNSSNLREAAGEILAVEYITSTDGPTGLSSPNKWKFSADDTQLYNSSKNATSDLTTYAGNPLMEWMKPLPVPSTGAGNIITVVNSPGKMARAETTLNNLVKGKKYKFTYSISTVRMNYSSLAMGSVVRLVSLGTESDIIADTTSFAYNESQWITKSIEFVAKDKSYHLEFSGLDDYQTTYTNIHVGKNAIKVIN